MANISVFKELYDWFYRSYGEASRERLLELMKNTIGIQRLKQLSQPDLAEFYCESLAYSTIGPAASCSASKRSRRLSSGFARCSSHRRVVSQLFALFCRNVLRSRCISIWDWGIALEVRFEFFFAHGACRPFLCPI